MRDRLRRLLPAPGLPYALFDTSVLVSALGLVWYVLTPVSPATRTALRDSWADVLSPYLWGWLLVAAGVVGIACAYGSHRVLRTGYIVVAAVSGMWGTILLLGAAFATGLPADPRIKAVGVALVFGFIVRRLLAVALSAEKVGRAGER